MAMNGECANKARARIMATIMTIIIRTYFSSPLANVTVILTALLMADKRHARRGPALLEDFILPADRVCE